MVEVEEGIQFKPPTTGNDYQKFSWSSSAGGFFAAIWRFAWKTFSCPHSTKCQTIEHIPEPTSSGGDGLGTCHLARCRSWPSGCATTSRNNCSAICGFCGVGKSGATGKNIDLITVARKLTAIVPNWRASSAGRGGLEMEWVDKRSTTPGSLTLANYSGPVLVVEEELLFNWMIIVTFFPSFRIFSLMVMRKLRK